MSNLFTSSIGKKFLMSLAGLFLITFLLVHLGINFLVILYEDTSVFNKAAHFMGSNIIVKVFEIFLFGGLILHIIYALILQIQNWLARPKRYFKSSKTETSSFSKWMIHTAVLILTFLVIHFFDFYFQAKFGSPKEIIINGQHYHDMASMVLEKFSYSGYVFFYIAAFFFLGFHLIHGFQSAFKTLGWNNRKITPVIQVLSLLYTIIVIGGYTAIPLIIYFQ